ncbi:hypothetical Protein YC6258_03117 [Gynuella sunshinyii YC6258]|uniref:Uncharacterized protein n=1 Tax=Gynuella sunshinyii YC6258 TaxID=1445510 RepID=A0A0C5VP33_9GAMM|nr:hypothetical Protein YC6258_03117 [Gynuella sunshinyii YC6258]
MSCYTEAVKETGSFFVCLMVSQECSQWDLGGDDIHKFHENNIILKYEFWSYLSKP